MLPKKHLEDSVLGQSSGSLAVLEVFEYRGDPFVHTPTLFLLDQVTETKTKV